LSKLSWLGANASFGVSTLLGASWTFFALHFAVGLFRRPPLWTVGISAAFAGAAILIGLGRPTGSRWRVPIGWQRAGHVKFAGLFGFSLGLGFATNLPSIGLLVLFLFAASTSAWYVAALFGIGFAFGRVAPLLSVVVKNRDREQRSLRAALHRAESLGRSAQWFELGVLVAIAICTMRTA